MEEAQGRKNETTTEESISKTVFFILLWGGHQSTPWHQASFLCSFGMPLVMAFPLPSIDSLRPATLESGRFAVFAPYLQPTTSPILVAGWWVHSMRLWVGYPPKPGTGKTLPSDSYCVVRWFICVQFCTCYDLLDEWWFPYLVHDIIVCFWKIG